MFQSGRKNPSVQSFHRGVRPVKQYLQQARVKETRAEHRINSCIRYRIKDLREASKLNSTSGKWRKPINVPLLKEDGSEINLEKEAVPYTQKYEFSYIALAHFRAKCEGGTGSPWQQRVVEEEAKKEQESQEEAEKMQRRLEELRSRILENLNSEIIPKFIQFLRSLPRYRANWFGRFFRIPAKHYNYTTKLIQQLSRIKAQQIPEETIDTFFNAIDSYFDYLFENHSIRYAEALEKYFLEKEKNSLSLIGKFFYLKYLDPVKEEHRKIDISTGLVSSSLI